MATTTNYGWTTPDDTALVKDGASAIRTLGSSVDTTTKNLNPSTTLGDIEYRSSTANTNTRLGIGSTGDVLTVAGGVPTWAAPAGGALPTFSAKRGSTQTISASTWTKIQFNSESWDTANAYDSTTNYRFTPLTAGYYQVNFGIWGNVSNPSQMFVAVYKNGSEWRFADTGTGSCQVYLDGLTDYIEIYVNSSSTAIQVESYFDAVGIRS